MFSGLTNQVSSWMGTTKGESDDKVLTLTENTETLASPDNKDSSPTKTAGASKLDMLSNVKSQFEGIGGWLGSSIPKLRKGDEGTAGTNIGTDTAEEATEHTNLSSIQQDSQIKDEDDNSSATGGADSGPQSIADSPTEEKEGQFGNVQSKALAGAKSFGSFLYSAVNKAGKTVSEASAKIKETVEKNSILGEFNKEQEAFMKNQAGNSGIASPPWVGCLNEEALKEECLSLSTDKRNFLRSPPTGVDFQFDYDVSYPVAMAIMEQDPNLEKMRYELVPKLISEDNFWRNYFYRVSLICQANELSNLSREGDSLSVTETATSEQPIVHSSNKEAHEFVSDTLQVNSQDLHEVEEDMKKLIYNNKLPSKEDDWELNELQDYEVVDKQNTTITTTTTTTINNQWKHQGDNYISDDLLEDDTTDLK